jgi:hypothetical protein
VLERRALDLARALHRDEHALVPLTISGAQVSAPTGTDELLHKPVVGPLRRQRQSPSLTPSALPWWRSTGSRIVEGHGAGQKMQLTRSLGKPPK